MEADQPRTRFACPGYVLMIGAPRM